MPRAPPGKDFVERWDGLTNGGRPVGDGAYRVVVAVAGGNQKDAGSIELHRAFFPVRGPHGNRGTVGDFGAPRNGDPVHKGFDVPARCGTPLAASVTGTVVKRADDSRLDGNYVVTRGLGERRKHELRANGRPVNPEPYLRAWDLYSWSTSSARRSDVRGNDGARGSAGSDSRGDRR